MAHVLKLAVNLKPPFLTGNAATPEMAYDAVMPRDANGHLVFPGTLLKGVFRDCLETMLGRLDDGVGLAGLDASKTRELIRAVFGRGSSAEDEAAPSAEAFAPDPGAVRFGDLRSLDAASEYNIRSKTRIERGELTGATVEGSLQKIEMVGGAGGTVPFEAELVVSDRVDAGNVEKLLNLAAKAIHAIGSSKSAGFGRIDGKITIKNDEPCALQQVNVDVGEDATSMLLEMTLDGPLLVDAARSGTNGFESSAIIPGGALKAAIAEAAHSGDTEFAAALSAISISHGFPALGKSGGPQSAEQWLPLLMPKSAACFRGISGGEFVDLAQHVHPFLLTQDNNASGPTMAVDWKSDEWGAAGNKFCELIEKKDFVPYRDDFLVRRTQVRTAIDYDKGSARKEGEEGQLFVQEVVLPTPAEKHLKECAGGKVVWRFRLRADKSGDLKRVFDALKKKMLFVGKLKTPATLELVAEKPNTQDSPNLTALETNGKRKVFHLHLQTPGLMITPDDVSNEQSGEALERYFEAWLGKEARLERKFVTFAMRGGYQALRYRENDQSYRPWVVVEPGSVFVVSLPEADEETLSKLAKARDFGLPVCAAYQEMGWQECPFLPENGYGAVAINPLPNLPLPAGATRIDLSGDDT